MMTTMTIEATGWKPAVVFIRAAAAVAKIISQDVHSRCGARRLQRTLRSARFIEKDLNKE
jgi:hypothetical protein